MTAYHDPIRKTVDAKWPTFRLTRDGRSVTMVTGFLRDAVDAARRRDCDTIAVVDPRHAGEHVVWRDGQPLAAIDRGDSKGGHLTSLPYAIRI